MHSLRLKVAVIVSGMLIALSAGMVAAQVTSRQLPSSPSPSPLRTLVAPTQAQPDPWTAMRDQMNKDPRWRQWGGRPSLRIGQDFVLRPDDWSSNVAVVFGSATIDGYVNGDVVVVLGSAQVASTAVIRGSLVVVGGNATVKQGALIGRDFNVVGGVVDTPPSFFVGGQQTVIGATAFGDRMKAVVPWITGGLMLGRPIVPDLRWVWWVVAIFFVVYFLVNLVFHAPVRASAETLAARPFSSFMTGLLVLLLTGPLSLLLTLSVIGVLVVPFALCAVVVAWVVGKVGVARWMGSSVVRVSDPESRQQSMRSFIIGSAVIVLIYIVPVLGLIAWALIGVFGLGSAVLAFFSALRRENPAPPKVRKEPKVDLGGRFPPAEPQTAQFRAETDPRGRLSDVQPAPPPEPESPPPPAAAGQSIPFVGDLTAYPRSSFWERLAAFGLDLLLVWIVFEFFLPGRGEGDRFFLLLMSYYIGFWTWKGTTVGGIICNLRVVRIDGAPMRFVDAVVRGLSGIFSIAAAGLGGLWILRDPEQQAWHDKISGTLVVTVPRNFPLP